MIIRLIRWLLGYVRFGVEWDNPAVLLNDLGKNGILFWDTDTKEKRFYLSVSRKNFNDYVVNSTVIRGKIKSYAEYGLPAILSRYRSRIGLLIGGIVCFVALCTVSLFAWNIQITGNETLSTERIRTVLSELGVKEGVPVATLQADRLPSELELKLPKISWSAVNIEGSTVSVEIRETKEGKPEPTSPSNLVASQDGTVTEIKIIGGKNQVKVGQTVRKGDLLAAGIVEYKYGTVGALRSHGEVIAYTRDTVSFRIPFMQTYTYQTGRTAQRHYCSFENTVLPLFIGNTSYLTQNSKISRYTPQINGAYLPIHFYTVDLCETAEKTVKIDQSTAKHMADQQREQFEETYAKSAKIIERKETVRTDDDILVLTVEYAVEKNIAAEQKIAISTVNFLKSVVE